MPNITPAQLANAILDGAQRTLTDVKSALDLPDEYFDALVALASASDDPTEPDAEYQDYTVTWSIDLSATSYEDAARRAMEIQQDDDPENIGHVYMVEREGYPVPVEIDLDVIDGKRV
jgi:hypothetical protein